MNSDWSVIQALVYTVTFYIFFLVFITRDDDDEDDGPGPGMMVPATATR